MLAYILAAYRFVLLIAVVGSLVIAAGALLFGAVQIAVTAAALVSAGDFSEAAGKQVFVAAIQILDLFLIGTVAYIIAVGIYSLFISRHVPLPVRLGVDDLDDLKEKIIGVIVVALGVLFLGQAVSWGGKRELLYLGGAIAVVIAALSYFLKRKEKPDGAESGREM